MEHILKNTYWQSLLMAARSSVSFYTLYEAQLRKIFFPPLTTTAKVKGQFCFCYRLGSDKPESWQTHSN